MKKYSKPFLHTNKDFYDSETVFLLDSGWRGSGCYTLKNLVQTQGFQDGFQKYVFQLNVVHHGDHTNWDQDWIFYFNSKIPSAITKVTFEGHELELEDYEGCSVGRVTPGSWPWNNEDDNIGSGAFMFEFSYPEGFNPADYSEFFEDFEISRVFVNDTHYRGARPTPTPIP